MFALSMFGNLLLYIASPLLGVGGFILAIIALSKNEPNKTRSIIALIIGSFGVSIVLGFIIYTIKASGGTM